MRVHHSGRRTGFSLIELTVATAIYSMGLGSLSLMMMVAVQGTTEAGHEGVAALQAASMAEQILMNPGAVGHYMIEPGGDPPDCAGGPACTPEEMAEAYNTGRGGFRVRARWHREDGGRYIGTGTYTVTRDPDEGWMNCGAYRAMVHDKKSVGCFCRQPAAADDGCLMFFILLLTFRILDDCLFFRINDDNSGLSVNDDDITVFYQLGHVIKTQNRGDA